MGKNGKRGARMPDCDSKKKWDKENVLFVTTKLFATTDADIIEFLKDKPRATTIKKALRLLIEAESAKGDN